MGDIDEAISPLQKQATQTQRLLGGLQDNLDKALESINDHENRLIKVENKTGTHDEQLRKARNDINELMSKLGKMENNNKMKDVIAGSNMADDSVNLILKAIDDMQEKIKGEVDDKLLNFVPLPTFKDAEAEIKVVNRRAAHSEQVCKDIQVQADAN